MYFTHRCARTLRARCMLIGRHTSAPEEQRQQSRQRQGIIDRCASTTRPPPRRRLAHVARTARKSLSIITSNYRPTPTGAILPALDNDCRDVTMQAQLTQFQHLKSTCGQNHRLTLNCPCPRLISTNFVAIKLLMFEFLVSNN